MGGTTLAEEVKATYGGSVPITTVHDNKVTDYFHSSQHAHLLHADNINKFTDKGTVIDTYDISREELMAQGRLIIKDPIDSKPAAITTMTYGAPLAITTMTAPITTI